MAGVSPSPRKPRRKVKKTAHFDNSTVKAEALVRTPSFPLAAFLWPARGTLSQWHALPMILMVTGLFRWAAGLWGYSGFHSPPMYGDYEAQRHWMEITTHLPISQWYFHDLQWWGLDYPPLTAYHSWVLGKIGSLINPAWFELYTSRGSEDTELKVFMRATVIVSEFLVYIPAVVIFARSYGRLFGVATWTGWVALVAILMQPSTILIDHIHFQYNTVMLGFVLGSMYSMVTGRYMWASICFVAALGFKQMALYYAPAVFAFLLGSCIFPRIKIGRFFGIAAVTIASFAVLILPLIVGTFYDASRGIYARPDLEGAHLPLPLFEFITNYVDTDAIYYPVIEQMIQMVHRIFPFSRGLFEDKVANFWCAANLVVKLRNFPSELLQKASLAATLAAIIPPCAVIFLRPHKELLPYAFSATAWGFFLFSYQVHEKSVLLPLMPMTVLLAGKQGLSKEMRSWVGFANILGAWTMFPLLERVHLRVPYAVLTMLWAYLLGLPPTSASAYFQEGQNVWVQRVTVAVHGVFYLAMGAWHIVELTATPPPGKPDLWVVANVGIGFVGFGLCYLWCLGKLIWESGLFQQGIPASKAGGKLKTK